MGDLNINLLNENIHDNSFINNMQSYHFLPLITKPTRFSSIENINPSLLDHIWVNNINYDYSCGLISNDFTDHFPVFLCIKNIVSPNSNDDKIKITFRLDSISNRNELDLKLSTINWITFIMKM